MGLCRLWLLGLLGLLWLLRLLCLLRLWWLPNEVERQSPPPPRMTKGSCAYKKSSPLCGAWGCVLLVFGFGLMVVLVVLVVVVAVVVASEVERNFPLPAP